MNPKNIQYSNEKLESLINQGIIPNDSQNLQVNNRLINSLKTVKSRFINQVQINHEAVIPQLFINQEINEENVLELMFQLEKEIDVLLKSLKNLNSQDNGRIDSETLRLLALKISFWGGKMSLSGVKKNGPNNHFLVNPNFDWNIYLNLINSVNRIDFENTDFNPIFEIMEQINGLGISFFTKHIHFITKENEPLKQLPIYDTIISKEWFNIKLPRSRDYKYFFNWIKEKSVKYKISNHDMERFIFNHAND